MEGPDSSYSCLEIHICWKVDREAKIEPPIHTEYFLSGGAMILIFIVGGANAAISFCMRSAIPEKITLSLSSKSFMIKNPLLFVTQHFLLISCNILFNNIASLFPQKKLQPVFQDGLWCDIFNVSFEPICEFAGERKTFVIKWKI